MPRTYKLFDTSKNTTSEIDAKKEKCDLSFNEFYKFEAEKYLEFYRKNEADFYLCINVKLKMYKIADSKCTILASYF